MKSPLFINLTNHPSAEWKQEQLAAAEPFGKIVDISFPAVSPEATTEEIHQLADKLVEDVLKTAKDANVITVHVTGEHTLTYALVTRLKAKSIKCVASTTPRGNPEMLPDGTKTSKFGFVQFREY